MTACSDCGDLDEKELYRQGDWDQWRCFVCYAKSYPESYAGRKRRGEV